MLSNTQQQNSISPAVTPFDGNTETLETSGKPLKYRLPESLRGVVREEDWEFMDSEQQVALIRSTGNNPTEYQINVKAEQSTLDYMSPNLNNPETSLSTQQVVVNSTPEVKVEQVTQEFQIAKQELQNIEKNFESGILVNDTPEDLIQNSPEIIPEQALTKEKTVVLTEEDKKRIEEERGGAPVWIPKLFGYKPSLQATTKATSKKIGDDSDLDIKNAKDWLDILLRKLFYRTVQTS
jgi:hypothetical protein